MGMASSASSVMAAAGMGSAEGAFLAERSWCMALLVSCNGICIPINIMDALDLQARQIACTHLAPSKALQGAQQPSHN